MEESWPASTIKPRNDAGRKEEKIKVKKRQKFLWNCPTLLGMAILGNGRILEGEEREKE